MLKIQRVRAPKYTMKGTQIKRQSTSVTHCCHYWLAVTKANILYIYFKYTMFGNINNDSVMVTYI